jgi:1,2-diacylglycerol 3-beta-galactosyltransferase
MKRLLFLIADTGGGHRAAAAAVERQLLATSPDQFEITTLDPFTSAKPRVIGGTAALYGPITRHARWLWGGLYHSTNSRSAVALLERTVLRSVTAAVAGAVERIAPDCVVSFHPLLNHISVRAVRTRSPTIPVVTVITDLVDIHVAWACRDVDAVVVPSPGGLDHCRRAGIPASRCHDFGLAVDRRFTELPSDPAGIAAIRERLGVRAGGFVVLVCGGADGSGGLVKHARAIAAGSLDVDVVVICGRNERARAALTGLRTAAGRPVTVLGYVNNMAEWMRASDVVVSKAGPGTIAEALCCGLPLLLVWYLPGQERGNVEWVVDIGAGRYVPRDEQLVDAVAELAEPGSAALATMRAAVVAAARPDATRRIAELIAAMAAKPAASRSSAGATR